MSRVYAVAAAMLLLGSFGIGCLSLAYWHSAPMTRRLCFTMAALMALVVSMASAGVAAAYRSDRLARADAVECVKRGGIPVGEFADCEMRR